MSFVLIISSSSSSRWSFISGATEMLLWLEITSLSNSQFLGDTFSEQTYLPTVIYYDNVSVKYSLRFVSLHYFHIFCSFSNKHFGTIHFERYGDHHRQNRRYHLQHLGRIYTEQDLSHLFSAVIVPLHVAFAFVRLHPNSNTLFWDPFHMWIIFSSFLMLFSFRLFSLIYFCRMWLTSFTCGLAFSHHLISTTSCVPF